MRRGMLALIAILAVLGWTGRGVIAQGDGVGANQVGQPVTIYNAAGDEVAEITVTEVIDPFEDYEEFSPPTEGQRYLLVAVTVENTGDAPFDMESYYLYLLDSLGRATSPTFALRTQDSMDEYPDLVTGPIDSGDEISGAIIFAVPTDTDLVQIVYWAYTDVQQLYLLADISGGGSQESGAGDEEASPVAEESPESVTDVIERGDEKPVFGDGDEEGPTPTEADEDTGPTGDVEATDEACAWAEDTLDRVNTLQPVGEELQAMGSGDIDVERVREIADELTDAADEQRNSDPPAGLEEASDNIADALDLYADLLNAAADAEESGDTSGLGDAAANINEANQLIQDAGEVTGPLLNACGVS